MSPIEIDPTGRELSWRGEDEVSMDTADGLAPPTTQQTLPVRPRTGNPCTVRDVWEINLAAWRPPSLLKATTLRPFSYVESSARDTVLAIKPAKSLHINADST